VPKVYSRRKGAEPAPKGAVYVGRGTVWGNPYVIGKDGDRAQVIDKYRAACGPRFRERVKDQLRGKDLVCWCAPKPCHADVLLEIANAD
jgi:hypothetical protein